MNLQTKVDERLWDAIRSTYESRNFSSAILDAIHFLSELIREKSGLEGDGANLVGRAFGGKAPVLKVNSLNTESEKNVQAGIEQLLRGLYQAVRNPRSHGISQDTEDDAVSIILFINHLLKTIDIAKSPFSQQIFVKRVLDPNFVPKPRYAELILAELPSSKRLEVFHDVFVKLNDDNAEKLKFFFQTLFDSMTDDEKANVIQTLSDFLRDSDEDDSIRIVIKAFTSKMWPSIAEVTRLRVENKLVLSISDGKYNVARKQCRSGSLGTWACRITEHFVLKDDFLTALIRKLDSSDNDSQDYVFNYFSDALFSLSEKPSPWLVRIVNKGLEAGDVRYKNLVDMLGFLKNNDDIWLGRFKKNLDNFVEIDRSDPPFYDDDIPF